jgi:hypothetical protein
MEMVKQITTEELLGITSGPFAFRANPGHAHRVSELLAEARACGFPNHDWYTKFPDTSTVAVAPKPLPKQPDIRPEIITLSDLAMRDPEYPAYSGTHETFQVQTWNVVYLYVAMIDGKAIPISRLGYSEGSDITSSDGMGLRTSSGSKGYYVPYRKNDSVWEPGRQEELVRGFQKVKLEWDAWDSAKESRREKYLQALQAWWNTLPPLTRVVWASRFYGRKLKFRPGSWELPTVGQDSRGLFLSWRAGRGVYSDNGVYLKKTCGVEHPDYSYYGITPFDVAAIDRIVVENWTGIETDSPAY